jgi:four helix bundle protein
VINFNATKMNTEDNPVVRLSLQFAIDIIDFSETLNKNNKFVIAKQLLKSGTSIGANIREAQHAESRADFIHKLKIAAKEAAETEYWLLLCKYAPAYPTNDILIEKCNELGKLLNKIISSTKANSPKSH